MVKKKLGEIASIVNGTLIGDGEIMIEHICPIDEAGEGDLTFIANAQYRKLLKDTHADAILVSPGTEYPGKNIIIVENPYVALGKLLSVFYPEETNPIRTSISAFIAITNLFGVPSGSGPVGIPSFSNSSITLR